MEDAILLARSKAERVSDWIAWTAGKGPVLVLHVVSTTFDGSDGGAGRTRCGRHLATVMTSQYSDGDKTFGSAFAPS